MEQNENTGRKIAAEGINGVMAQAVIKEFSIYQ